MKKQPIFCLFIAFSTGILIKDEILVTDLWGVLISAITFLFLFLLFFIHRSKKAALFILLFIGIGFITHSLYTRTNDLQTFEGKQILTFQVVKKLNSTEKSKRYIVAVIGIKDRKQAVAPFNAVLNVPKHLESLDFKHAYSGKFYVNAIQSPQNNYQFNYRKYMQRNDVLYQLYSNEEPAAEKKETTITDQIKQKRLEVLQNIDMSKLSSKSKDFLKGIILADRTDMDTEISQDFTKSGLIHFLAISGTHMVIIFWLLKKVLDFLIPVRYRKGTVIVSLLLIWCFAVFIDYGSSVVRSCIMLSVYYIMVLLQRKPDLLHSIGVSGLTILLFDTQQIFDIGFQLSFLAVFGIYWLNQPILNLLPKARNTFQNFMWSVVSITLAAQIITLPLVLYYFHQFSLVSIISNLIIVPMSEIVIVFSLFMTLMLGGTGEIDWISFVYDFLIVNLLKLIHYFAEVNILFFEDIPMSLSEMLVLFVLIYLLRALLKERSLKNILRTGNVLILFFILRFGLNFYYFSREEFLEHQYFNQKIFSVKKHDRVVFYLPENLDKNKVKKYLVQSYVVSARIKNYEIIQFNDKEFSGLKYRNKIKFVK
ncbi:ComEC/Rec2 family competence protein [Elizabethkingia meningoseptica]|uniref:ComEC/Rec2 family competence protein n=1 Tax=Elizabethkingia meningoseptica TaxID=238 RepID=UPI003891763C